MKLLKDFKSDSYSNFENILENCGNYYETDQNNNFCNVVIRI